MSLPDGLRADVGRGPHGTELMGISVALPAKETQTDGVPWDSDDWQAAVQHYQPQLLEALRVHVGGAPFKTEPVLNVDGPHSDPLQGNLYVMTVAAWFSPLDLPVDCPAYRARSEEASRG